MDKWFWRVWIGFAVLWTIGTFAGTYVEYRSVLNALRTGHVGTVEGRVERFAPSPYQAYESFRVAGHRFAYSDNDIQAGLGRCDRTVRNRRLNCFVRFVAAERPSWF